MPYLKLSLVPILIAALTAVSLSLPGPGHAGATITVKNLDGTDEGFNDPGDPDTASTDGGNPGTTLGEQRLAAFTYAADIWAALLNSSQEIFIGVNFDPLACDALVAELGAGGTNTVHRDFTGATYTNTWYPAPLANALAGTDLNPDADDISAKFNSAIDDNAACAFPMTWYYGLDGNPPADTLDFVSVVLHELAHGLGFQTFVELETGAKLNGFDDIFMLYLKDRSTGEQYSDMTDAERVTASTNSGNLHWFGYEVRSRSIGLTSGRAPNGNVEMYAPHVLEPGSSVSHFSTSLSPDELMEPAITDAIHDVGLALAVMEDIGWSTNLSSSPPPNSSSGGGGGGCFITTAIMD